VNVDEARLTAALPGYELHGEIGRGAWGTVLRAEHRQLRRPVAIKVLREDYAGDAGVQARFGREARILAALDHPHIVRIFDYVEDAGLCLFVMELLPGGTLRDLLTTEGVAIEAACSIAVAAASALHHAHRAGVLHRDIKPENLMFNATGVLRVTDFGIAKVMGGSGAALTRAGEVFGTASYIAPEQVVSAPLGPPTDVYALATVLYELLSGRLPFSSDDSPMATLYRRVNEAPVELGEVAPWVPADLAAAVMGGLATDPAGRPADAEEFGVRIADAALGAWGSGWVERTGVEVVSSGRIAAHISASPHGFDVGGASRPPGRGASPARWRAGRRPLLAGALALAAVVAAGAIVLATRGGSQKAVAPGPSATSSPSAQPSPTATAAPAGRLVLADDAMNDPTSGWTPDPGQGDNGTATFKPDGYHVASLKPNTAPLTTYSVASPFALRLTSLVVTVDALVTGSPADGTGVRCDQGAGRSGLRYTFEVHGDGTWVIFKIDDKGSAALAQGSDPSIHPQGQINTIQGRCDEKAGGMTSLIMTVNGKQVGVVTDQHPGQPVSWHAALVVYRDPGSAATDVRFTHFQIHDGSV
jgi:hypothetical protein